MAELVTCFVTNSLEKGAAFAVRADNDEKVYIAASVAEELNLCAMDRIEALLVRNNIKPDKTPWYTEIVRLLPKEAGQ